MNALIQPIYIFWFNFQKNSNKSCVIKRQLLMQVSIYPLYVKVFVKLIKLYIAGKSLRFLILGLLIYTFLKQYPLNLQTMADLSCFQKPKQMEWGVPNSRLKYLLSVQDIDIAKISFHSLKWGSLPCSTCPYLVCPLLSPNKWEVNVSETFETEG